MNATVTRDTEGRRLIVERQVTAGPDLVWSCWTEARHLREWWGPQQWRADVFELDPRPGGRWRYRLRPDREHDLEEEHWGVAVYSVVDAPHRLSFLDGVSTPDGTPILGTEMPTDVTIVPDSDGSHVAIVVQFPSVAALHDAEALGMVEGFTDALDRLETHATQRKGTES